jgi:hypothetical protein
MSMISRAQSSGLSSNAYGSAGTSDVFACITRRLPPARPTQASCHNSTDQSPASGGCGRLQLEDVALLSGSILLFLLSLAMWFIRNPHRSQPA